MNIEISNGYIVTLKNNNLTIQHSNIYISNDKIVGILNKPNDFIADKIIDATNKLVIPGFINCHTHAYMSLFRNYADDLSFSDWLFGHIMPMEDKLTGEDAYWSTLLSCIEMIKTGTTTFLDMHMFPHFVAQAVNDIGIRAVLSRGLVGDSANDEGGIKRIKEAIEDIQEWSEHNRISFMLAPHAPYTCSYDYLQVIAKKAQELNLGIHIHLSETENEVAQTIQKYNCSPIELMEKAGIFNNHTVAAHCVYLSDKDISLLKKYNVNVATNPVSNLKLGNGIAPVTKLINNGVNVCLGTDSDASNNNLNMINELNTLTLIHKGINKDAKAVSAYEAFDIATINGAKALGICDIGQISVGMKADISIMNLEKPWLYPKNDLIAAICYSATGSEFETVIIDGNIVMENGKIKLIDENLVYKKCEEILTRVKVNK